MKSIDYTLYNKVKAKFLPQHHTVIFVSLIPENVERLEGITFNFETIAELRELVGRHAEEALPYAVIGGFEGEGVAYHFACREFVQEEDLISGKIVTSSIGIYHNKPVDIKSLKQEMQRYSTDTLLFGNA